MNNNIRTSYCEPPRARDVSEQSVDIARFKTGASMRVLILDDEKVIVSTICSALQQYGHRPYGVTSHSEAIAVAEVFRPQIFITGFINCCQHNGCDTACEIVDLLGRCRVLVASGAAYELAFAAARQCRDRGYDFAVWHKPFRVTDLLAWISNRQFPSL